MACSPDDMSKKTRFRAMHRNVCVFRLIENGRVAITAAVHVE